MKSIIKNSNRIKIVSNERVVDELHKILKLFQTVDWF